MGSSPHRLVVYPLILLAFVFTSCTFWTELSNPEAANLYHQGKDRLSKHKFTEAIKSFEELANKYPEYEYGDDALFNAAYIYVIQEDYKKANKTFKLLKSRYPRSERQFSTNLWIEVTDTILQLSAQQEGKRIEKKIVRKPVEEPESEKPDSLTSKERKELKRLRKQNKRLKKRLKKLEEAIGNME